MNSQESNQEAWNREMEEIAHWQEIKDLAMKYFPNRIQSILKTEICNCCGETHSEYSIVLKPRKTRKIK